MRTYFKFLAVTAFVVSALSAPLHADLVPVFEYDFPASNSNLMTDFLVVDQSTGGINSTRTGFSGTGDGLSTNVPSGMSGKSADFGTSSDARAIKTGAKRLLTATDVAANGGFTYDSWIYCTDTASAGTIISYAGTEDLRVTPDGTIRFAIGTLATHGGELFAPIEANTWYHVTATFDTLGNPAVDDAAYPGFFKVAGVASLSIDGVEIASGTMTKDGFGDYYNRSTSIGLHPAFTANDFSGLIYNPSVSLGVAAVPEPATGVISLILGLVGLLAYAWRKHK